MTTDRNIVKYLWKLSVVFVSFLLIGSFIISRDFIELSYLVILYAVMMYLKIQGKKSESHFQE